MQAAMSREYAEYYCNGFELSVSHNPHLTKIVLHTNLPVFTRDMEWESVVPENPFWALTRREIYDLQELYAELCFLDRYAHMTSSKDWIGLSYKKQPFQILKNDIYNNVDRIRFGVSSHIETTEYSTQIVKKHVQLLASLLTLDWEVADSKITLVMPETCLEPNVIPLFSHWDKHPNFPGKLRITPQWGLISNEYIEALLFERMLADEIRKTSSK